MQMARGMGFQERFQDDPLYARTGRKFGSSRKLLGEYFQNTHMHGLPHAASARTAGRTAFWAFLFLIGLGEILVIMAVAEIYGLKRTN